MCTYSLEHQQFMKRRKRQKVIIVLFQIGIISLFLLLWEFLAYKGIINDFLFSSPSNILHTIHNLMEKELWKHIYVTFTETLISFFIASLGGILLGALLWWSKILAKILDPYLVIINSLPKVALGPLIIIWVGTSTNSIIFMALTISIFTSITNIYNAFMLTDENYIVLMKSLGATRKQIFFKVIFPANLMNIINTLKINISMSLIGVIMGELLVSKEGIGYLIMYGSQVFNLDLIITGIIILMFVSYFMYLVIHCLEKILIKH